MRMFVRGLAALAVTAGFVWLAACGSSTGPSNVSLSGNYTLTQFILGGSDLSGAMLRLQRYCEAHPADSLAQAMLALTAELYPGRRTR